MGPIDRGSCSEGLSEGDIDCSALGMDVTGVETREGKGVGSPLMYVGVCVGFLVGSDVGDEVGPGVGIPSVGRHEG